MKLVFQYILIGIAIGSVYGLIAFGFTMIYQALQHFNFAQGHLVMFGGFIGLTAVSATSGFISGVLQVFLVFLLTGAVFALICVGPHFLVHRPILTRSEKKDEGMALLLGTLGVGFILEDLAIIIWSSEPQFFPRIMGKGLIDIAGIGLPVVYVWIFIASIGLVVVINYFMKFTKLGFAMRAFSQDKDTAALMGVNLMQTLYAIFALTYVVGGIAGVLLAPSFYVFFGTGFIWGIKGFTAAIFGGLGSIPGAFIGGIMLGVLESMGAGLISAAYRDVIALVLLIVILIFKPTGIMGKKIIQKV